MVIAQKLIELSPNFKVNCNLGWNKLNFSRIESILEFGKQRTIYIYNKMAHDIEFCSNCCVRGKACWKLKPMSGNVQGQGYIFNIKRSKEKFFN